MVAVFQESQSTSDAGSRQSEESATLRTRRRRFKMLPAIPRPVMSALVAGKEARMRKLLLVGAPVLFVALSCLRESQPPPLPGPPLSASIAAIALATSTEARRLPSLAPMLLQVLPAVVSSTVQTHEPSAASPLFMEPPYRRFSTSPPAEPLIVAAGSGVMINPPRGLIVTNDHVVKNAERIGVALSDGWLGQVPLIGVGPATDIALFQIAAPDLMALPLGNSAPLEISDCVEAIGDSSGRDHAATMGMVRTLGRTGLGNERYEEFIQTDAAANSGMSGGALVSVDGKLVETNAAIVDPVAGNAGIAFALSISIVKDVAGRSARFGKVTRGRCAAVTSDHPSAMPSGMQAEKPPGAIVTGIVPARRRRMQECTPATSSSRLTVSPSPALGNCGRASASSASAGGSRSNGHALAAL